MKQVSKIVHTLQFGKYRQEWELSFDYDNESTENVSVVAHNYKQGKYIGSNDITKTLDADLVSGMIDSIDLDEERNSEAESKFDDKFANSKGEDIFTQLGNFFKP